MNKPSNSRVIFDENTSTSEIDNELVDKWLGRDWPETVDASEAMRIATECQATLDAGDGRDYTEILAEVVG